MSESVNLKEVERSDIDRNDALDFFRALALILMVSAHFMRGFVPDQTGTWGYVVRGIFESAPVFFFIAFGMTLIHSARGKHKYQRLLEFGFVSLLHQAYLLEIKSFKPDFLLFLWFMFLIVMILKPLFMNRYFRTVLMLLIIIMNLLWGQELFGIFGAHPFGPFPWAFLVLLGISIGMKKPDRQGVRRIVACAVVSIIVGLMIPLMSMLMKFDSSLVIISKLKPTSSSYLLLTSGIALLVYVFLNHIKTNQTSVIKRFARVLSVYLLIGTVIHYFTNTIVATLFEQSGYGEGMFIPPIMFIVSIASVSLLLYAVIQIMANVREIIIAYVLSEKLLYAIGWILVLAVSSLVMYLSLSGANERVTLYLGAFGMLLSSFVFMRKSNMISSIK